MLQAERAVQQKFATDFIEYKEEKVKHLLKLKASINKANETIADDRRKAEARRAMIASQRADEREEILRKGGMYIYKILYLYITLR